MHVCIIVDHLVVFILVILFMLTKTLLPWGESIHDNIFSSVLTTNGTYGVILEFMNDIIQI